MTKTTTPGRAPSESGARDCFERLSRRVFLLGIEVLGEADAKSIWTKAGRLGRGPKKARRKPDRDAMMLARYHEIRRNNPTLTKRQAVGLTVNDAAALGWTAMVTRAAKVLDLNRLLREEMVRKAPLRRMMAAALMRDQPRPLLTERQAMLAKALMQKDDRISRRK